MKYYLKQGAQEAYLKIGNLISDAGATAQIFEIADNPKVVFKRFRDMTEARSLEFKITHMVNNHPSEDLKPIGIGSLDIHNLAWPTHCVYSKGEFSGFLMPYVDHSSSISLNKIFSVKSREKNNISEDLRWRIYVARNLVSVYHTLHKAGYFVIDTKPANIRTYKDSPAISILDCDGFRHESDTSATGFITEEYIAPTSIGKPFSELGGEQDVFAVSILVFQILNNGIHPFQGIQSSSTAFTTQQLIEKRAYPYGKKPPLVLQPSPISSHSLFPDDLQDYFDKIFSGNSRTKSVQGLLKILDDLKEGVGLTTCANPKHFAFAKGCPSCFLDDISSKSTKQPTKKPSQPTSPQASSNSIRPTKKSTSSGLGWLFFGCLIAIGILVAVSEKSRTPSTSSVQRSSSSVAVSQRSLSAKPLCEAATNADPNNIRWETGSSYLSYVEEAKARSLHCGVATAVPSDELCQLARIGGQWETRSKYLQYVREAKARGLSCSVGVAVTNSNRSTNAKSLSNTEVCARATTGGENSLRWVSNPEYVSAARSRGLPCGVPSEYRGENLCRLATNNGTWETNPKYVQYVNEAKRQGISCGILGVNSGMEDDVIVAIELNDAWRNTKYEGKCYAVAKYKDGSSFFVEKISPGNFNVRYRLNLQLKGYFDSKQQQITFDFDNSGAVMYDVPGSIDPDKGSIEFGSDLAGKFQRGNSLEIYSSLKPIRYQFPLRGTKAAIEIVKEGKCQ